MKVLIATAKPFAAEAVQGIKKEFEGTGHEVVLLEKYETNEQLLDAVKDVDAMIVRSDKITAEVLDAAKNLKIVVRAGAGFDSIDCQYAKEKNVVVENTPGQNANAVAELVMGMLVYVARNHFNGKSGHELMGRRLGLLAFGNVGRNVARIAKGFGMEVSAYDAFVPAEAIEKEGVHACKDQKELFEISDVLSLHIPATPETIKSINYDMVNLMSKGGILVNAARKEVIDEQGVMKALTEREDLKYITDIAAGIQSELNEKFGRRVFATAKKMGAETAEANINAGLAAANQIVDFFKNGNTRFQVNK